MALDFTNTIGYAALQARQRALESQRQYQQSRDLQSDAAINQAGDHNLTSLVDDFEKHREHERQQAFNQAAAEGQEAGMMGRATPKYTTDEMNRGAATGAASGRMAMAQFLAKRSSDAAAAEAKARAAAAAASTAHDYKMAEDKAHQLRAHELALDPRLQEQMLARIRARNRGLKDAALAGNPALTTGAKTKADEDYMAGAARQNAIRTAMSTLDQFSDKDFGIGGGVHNIALQGRKMFGQGLDMVGLGGISRAMGIPLQPEEQGQLDKISAFRHDVNAMFNSLLAEASGKAVTDNELRRKLAEFNMMFPGGFADIGLMFNDRAAMRTAMQRALEIEAHMQNYRDAARRGNVQPTVEDAEATSTPVVGGPVVQGALGPPGTNITGIDQTFPEAGGEAPDYTEPPTYQESATEDTLSPPDLAGTPPPAPQPAQAPSPPQAPPRPPPKHTAKSGAKPAQQARRPEKAPANAHDQFADNFMRADGGFDADSFVEDARAEGWSDAEIHAQLVKRGM
jgi:hypothetical protein